MKQVDKVPNNVFATNCQPNTRTEIKWEKMWIQWISKILTYMTRVALSRFPLKRANKTILLIAQIRNNIVNMCTIWIHINCKINYISYSLGSIKLKVTFYDTNIWIQIYIIYWTLATTIWLIIRTFYSKLEFFILS
jgi:hypothetical protein